MRSKPRRDSIAAIGVLAAAAVVVVTITMPSAIHGMSITSRSTGPNSPVVAKRGAAVVPPPKATAIRPSRTAMRSKVNEFKDIDIEDVLLEAENALKIAQTSLVVDDDDHSGATEAIEAPRRASEFKDINIDDVLLEAENALKVARVSIVDEESNASGGAHKADHETGTPFESLQQDPASSADANEKSTIDVTEIVSSTLGGILLGSLLGSVAAFQLFDVRTLGYSAKSAEFAIPIAAGVGLGGIAGLTGSSQDNLIGMAVRGVLGAPTKALASAMVSGLRDAAIREVEKTKTAVDRQIAAAIERAKIYLLVLTALSSAVYVGVLIANGDLIVGDLIVG
eukprot:CAMPEP_0197173924 /NCGR_PEP_ID=MMETSP1423-20130617/660_1 /TAXON_ID=476441 /ORGANISM="Pseudo-nitzschia heimii, Strain UNC1101" /LENGTH=338 /DNA_ID=CAMNT_0042622793 /DNA_START=369 /DNA_END=1385 /DNA_ORIENTATION=+